MKARDVHQQVTQDNSFGSAQVSLANQHITCVIPMTFSQKLYQSHPLEIAEEYEQALEANSLHKINILFSKVLEVGEGS